MSDVASLRSAIAEQIRMTGVERESSRGFLGEEKQREKKEKSLTNWVILVGLLILVVGGLPWKRVRTWRTVGAMLFVQVNLVLARHQKGVNAVTMRQISFGVAVLSGVFSYTNSILVGIALVVLMLGTFPVTSYINEADVAQGASVLLASSLSRVSWSFYRDLYTVFAAHSNKMSPACYAAVSLTLLAQLFLTLTFAHLLSSALTTFLVFPSHAPLTTTLSRLKDQLPSISLLTLVCFLVVSSCALHYDFPGNSSWFW
eukprot:TRINITY_DN16329_c0_g1_i1.p1 TRINITY_DN16329_c0_g1~~TRINITY_DN16329_c0_g1_i1.p1  ORF type:complete len:258 (+),score=55.45 TRINITY_DN16329_c0_g1_i1:42-815(+)